MKVVPTFIDSRVADLRRHFWYTDHSDADEREKNGLGGLFQVLPNSTPRLKFGAQKALPQEFGRSW
jgi:hypothetical protein